MSNVKHQGPAWIQKPSNWKEKKETMQDKNAIAIKRTIEPEWKAYLVVVDVAINPTVRVFQTEWGCLHPYTAPTMCIYIPTGCTSSPRPEVMSPRPATGYCTTAEVGGWVIATGAKEDQFQQARRSPRCRSLTTGGAQSEHTALGGHTEPGGRALTARNSQSVGCIWEGITVRDTCISRKKKTEQNGIQLILRIKKTYNVQYRNIIFEYGIVTFLYHRDQKGFIK